MKEILFTVVSQTNIVLVGDHTGHKG